MWILDKYRMSISIGVKLASSASKHNQMTLFEIENSSAFINNRTREFLSIIEQENFYSLWSCGDPG